MRKVLVVLLLTALISAGVVFVVQPWKSVTVAVLFPASGVGAPLGLSLTQSLLWAFDYFNERSFVPEYRPVVIKTDDIEEGIKEAINSGAVVIVGASTSTYASRLQKAADEAGLSVISVGALSQALAEKDNLFRPHSGTDEAFVMGEILCKSVSRYAVFASAQNPIYVVPFLDALTAGMGGVRPYVYLSADGGASREMLFSALAEIMESDAVVLVLPDFSSAVVVRQLRYLYLDMPIWIASWGATARFAEIAGSMGEGVCTIASWRPDALEASHPFVQYVRRLYGDELDPFPLTLAYDAVAMLDEAISRGEIDKVSIAKELGEIRSVVGINGPFVVDENGDGHPPLYLQEVSKRRWRLLEALSP
jgi:ABC-type branched-subunit amino acid transport system substrate-binding protein